MFKFPCNLDLWLTNLRITIFFYDLGSIAIIFIRNISGIGLILNNDVYVMSGEIGYWLAEPYWGQGIATEAVRTVR